MIADSAEIKFECPQCGQSIAVDASGAGVSTNCPTCDYPLVVPSLSSLHDRQYGADAPPSASRTVFAEEDAGVSADEVQELREELAEALRRGDEFEHALAAARKETARLQQQLQTAVEDGERLAARAAQAQGFHADLQTAHGELAQSQQRAAAVGAQLAAARTVISDLGGRLAAVEENRTQWEQAFAQTAEQANANETQMAGREAELRGALAKARGATEALGGERTALRGQLESVQNEARAAAAAAAEKLTAAQAAYDDAEAGRQGLAGRCQALRKESETLRHDLSEIHTGRELLALRDRFLTLDTEHQRATAALARSTAEVQTLTAATDTLRAELTEARTLGAEAERRAEAASESALVRDNAVLRGIIERQNSVGEERYVELRRLRRARLALRILYAFVGLALVGLAALAIDYLPDAVKHLLHEWFGL